MKKLLAFLSLSLFAFGATAQLNVSIAPPYDNAQDLVQNVLLGQGVTVSNVVFSGDSVAPNAQIGYFDGTNSNIGISQGIVMSSGGVTGAVGPNNNGSFSVGGNSLPQDSDLVDIVNQQLFDRAVLEFDFIPTGDTLRFRYVFASEEYNEFACSQYNDVFAFFMSGPGFNGPFANGAENIALVPGTTTPVAINTINLGVAGTSGDPDTCAAADPNWQMYSQYFVDNPNGTSVQYDGFTTVLTATAVVQCNQTYHIKLAIADAFDGGYDSGVFLEAESFSSNEVQINLNFTSGNLTTDSAIVEGCTDATFEVVRNIADSAEVVRFQLGGSAVNGVDYTAIADSILLDSGVFSQSFTIEPLLDSVAEGIDTLTISIERVNSCGDTLLQSVNVYLLDDYQIQLTPIDTTVGCPGDSVPLLVEVTNAINEVTWIWSTGDTVTTSDSTVIWVTPMDTLEVYYVSVTDSCAFSIENDSVQIALVLENPTSTTVGGTSFCPGSDVDITATGIGGSGHGFIYSWDNGSNTAVATVSPTTDSTWYYVTVTDSCTNLFTVDSAQVVFNLLFPSSFTWSPLTISCSLPTTIAVNAVPNSPGPLSYLWSSGSTSDTAIVTPVVDSWYYVTITDDCNGLAVIDSFQVLIAPLPPAVLMPADTTMPCPGTPVDLIAEGSGGAGTGFTYEWSNGEMTDSINVQPLFTTTYSVTVGDACGLATIVDSVTISVTPYSPLMVTAADQNTACPGDDVTITAVATAGVAPYTYDWSTGATTANTQVSPATTTDYIIEVSDNCGGVASDTLTVTVPNFDPIIVANMNTQVLCANDPVTLTAVATGGTGVYTYAWAWGDTLTSTDSSIADTPSETSTYQLAVLDECNSSNNSTATVTVPTYDPINVVMGTDSVLLCMGDSVTLVFLADGGTGVYTTEWLPDGPGFIDELGQLHYAPVITGTVTVDVTDQCDLEGSAGVFVEVEDCTVRGVNVITPNGDNMNEVLWFRNLDRNPLTQLTVLDRWGRILFEDPDYQNDWNGDNHPDGTYFYILTLADGTTLEGFFTIIRG